MQTFSKKIVDRLHKYYGLNRDEAQTLVDEEWDYIEEEFVNETSSVENIVKNIISLYMVA
jgi:hypothetical protein